MELSNIMVASGNNGTSERCALFDGNEYKCNVILAIRKSMAALSLVGCVFMMVIIWLFRKYTLFAQRLILYLTIAAFFSSISYLMQSDRPDGPLCNFEAFWVTLWDWAVLNWTCCITFNLLMSVARMTSTEKYEIMYHCVGWGIPLFVSALPFIGDHYGPAGAWCWITDEYMDGTEWRFSIWYGPLFIIIFLMFICYIYVLFTLKKMIGVYQGTQEPQPQHAERDRRLIRKEIRPLAAYPCIYLVLSIFALINRIQNAVAPDDPIFALVILQAITSPMVGAINAIVYGLDRTTRKKLNRRSVKKAFNKKREHSSDVIQEYNPAQKPTTSNNESNNDAHVAADEQQS
ncbi:uncharacterized protein [Amphiura filiformis]|uniref:uncharacterized protein isoform X2 n=1 Tax=Amphiura filiformis TaxID=82378 RepID=UPI003B2218A5